MADKPEKLEKIPKVSELDDKHRKMHEANQKIHGHVTEEEALAQAKKDGIEFVDSYHVVKIGEFVDFTDTKTTHDTHAKADTARKKLKNPDQYTVAQVRTRKVEEEN